jgi:hypothetical protein
MARAHPTPMTDAGESFAYSLADSLRKSRNFVVFPTSVPLSKRKLEEMGIEADDPAHRKLLKKPAGGLAWGKLTRDSWASGYFSKGHMGGVAVKCGTASGIVVVDIDHSKSDDKVDGIDYWKQLTALNGEPNTFRVMTPSGGLHLYYKYDKTTANLKTVTDVMTHRASGKPVSIDLRCEGGYVLIASPQNVSHNYKIVDNTAEIAEMPDWLYESFNARAYRAGVVASEASSSVSDETAAFVNDAGYCVIEQAAPAGAADVARAQIGDEVTITGVPTELTVELLGQILSHIHCPSDYTAWKMATLNVKSVVREGVARQHTEDVRNVWNTWCASGENYDEAGNAREWCGISAGQLQDPRAHVESLIGQAVAAGFRIEPPAPEVNPFYASDMDIYDLAKLDDGTAKTRQFWRENIAKVVGRIIGPDEMYVVKMTDSITRQVAPRVTSTLTGLVRWIRVEGREKKVRLSQLVKELAPEWRGTDVKFTPPGELPADCGDLINIAQRFAVDERWEGDINPEVTELITRLIKVHCGADQHAYEPYLWLLAFTLQHPDVLPEVAVLLTGTQGTGKSTLAQLFLKIMGPLGRSFTGCEQVLGDFNGPIEGLKFCNMDELIVHNWGDQADRMKPLTTGDRVNINNKGEKVRTVPNKMFTFITTNHLVPMKVEEMGRRYICLRCSDELKGDSEFFDRFYDVIMRSEDGLRQALEFFMRVELPAGYHPRKHVVDTEAGRMMVGSGMSVTHQWLVDYLKDKPRDAPVIVPVKEARHLLSQWTEDAGYAKVKLGVYNKELKVKLRIPAPKNTRFGDKQLTCWHFDIPTIEKQLQGAMGAGFTI